MSALLCLVDPSLKDFVGHHAEYDMAVAEGVLAAGMRVVCLGHRDARPAVAGAAEFRGAFRRDIWGFDREHPDLPPERRALLANADFLADLSAAVEPLGLKRGDTVFGHMITHNQLLGWAQFVEAQRGRGVRTVLLLRYQPDFYRAECALEAFRLLERLRSVGEPVQLTSDSARLADQLQALTDLPITVLPIPHSGPGASLPASDRSGPLRVVSLGNARDEKGLIELLTAIRVLEARGESDRFRFVLQVNDPDPPCARALERLRLDCPSNVELQTAALDPAAYQALLQSADVVALPYWRSIYETRTSGVLVEALGAGKPVLCTADTWLSDQITEGQGLLVQDRDPADLALKLVEMHAGYAAFAAAAQGARPAWRAFHSPENFARSLARGGEPLAERTDLRALVLYPWGDAHKKASGASLRVNLFARFLAQRATVRVLEDAGYGRKLIDGISFESAPLLQAADESRLGRFMRATLPKWLKLRNGEELHLALHLYPGRNPGFVRQIEEAVRWADLVFLEYTYWSAVVAAACRRYGKPLVLTAHDVVSDQVGGLLHGPTARAERAGMRRADARVAISAADQARFAAWGAPATLIPGCADVDAARPATRGSRRLLNRLCGLDDEDDTPLLMFAGSNFRPNIVAVEHLREIVARTAERFPDLAFRVVVVGACWPPTREARFIALGFVPDALLILLYQHCAAVLIPLTLGTGASLKTIEAFAAGAPILGTSMAFRGMEVEPGVTCLREDDLQLWPELIARLTADPELAGRLRAAATATGDGLHYERGFAAYLPLSPRLAVQPIRHDRRGAARLKATLALAAAAQEVGLLEEAQELARHAQALAPDNLAPLAYEAQSGLAQGEPAAAYVLGAELLQRGGEPVETLRGMAQAADLEGDPARAALRLAQAARVAAYGADHPDMDGRLREAIWTAFKAGERAWVRAVTGEIARVGAAAHGDYHYLFASLEEEAEDGDAQRALRHARLGLEGGFDRFWCLRLIGALSRSLDRHEEALDAFREALAAARDEDGRRMALDGWLTTAWRLHNRGQSPAALAAVEALLAIDPTINSGVYLRAELLKADPTRRREAIAAYEEAERLGFDRCWAWLHAGRLRIAEGDLEAGAERLVEAAGLAVDAHQRAQGRAGMEEALDALARGASLTPIRAWVERFLAVDPDAPVLLRYAELYACGPAARPDTHAELKCAVAERFHEDTVIAALAFARRGEQLFPEDETFAYYTGECLNILGHDLEAAEAAYSRALVPGADAFWTSFNRAQVRAKLGRVKEARDDLQVALRAARTGQQREDARTSLQRLSSGS